MIICTDERKVQRYCTVLGYVAYVNTVRLSHRLNYNFDYHTAIHALLIRMLTRATVYLISLSDPTMSAISLFDNRINYERYYGYE